MTIKIPQIDDFGDRKLNTLATKYRNALQDERLILANDYLLRHTKPLSKPVKNQLTSYFNLLMEQNKKADIDIINNILSSVIPDGIEY